MQSFSLLPIILMSLASFFIVSFGDSVFLNSTAHSSAENGSVSSHCKAVCSPFLTEKQKAPTNEARELPEPDPFSYAGQYASLYASLLYAVALAALCLIFLKRRPPDLVIEYATLRN